MFKGLCVCYTVVTVTFFSVAISGNWAFGNQAAGIILTNVLDNVKSLLPKWFILMTNTFTLLQLSAVGVVYLQLTNEVLERTLADPKSDQFSVRNLWNSQGANFRDLPGVIIGPDNKIMWDDSVPRQFLPSGKPLIPDYAVKFKAGSSVKPFGRSCFGICFGCIVSGFW